MVGAPEYGLTLAATPTALGPRTLAALPAAGVTLRVLAREEIPAAVAQGGAELGLVDGLTAPNDPLRHPDVAPLTTYGVGEEPVCVLLPKLSARPARRAAPRRSRRRPLAGRPRRGTAPGPPPPGERRRGLPPPWIEGTDVRTLAALAAAGTVSRCCRGLRPPASPGRWPCRSWRRAWCAVPELVHGGSPRGAAALVDQLLERV